MMADNINDIYYRLLKARNSGRGFKLSAEEVRIFCAMDDAIATLLENIEEENEGIEQISYMESAHNKW